MARNEGFRRAPRGLSLFAAPNLSSRFGKVDPRVSVLADDAAEQLEPLRLKPGFLAEFSSSGGFGRLPSLDMTTRKGNVRALAALVNGKEATPAVRNNNARDLLHVKRSADTAKFARRIHPEWRRCR